MKFAIPFPVFRRAATLLLIACLFGRPDPSRAGDDVYEPAVRVAAISGVGRAEGGAAATNETGVRLLEAALLPGRVPLRSVKCDPLAVAVTRTTLAHPHDALVILDAALTRRVRNLHDKLATLPCVCARRIFLASVAAAPRRSSELLDLAMELYPDCTTEFAGALSDFNAGHGPAGTGSDAGNPSSSVSVSSLSTPMGASLFDRADPGGEESSFGVGFGPGSPGSPGFSGSGPSGGLALPPPAVTSVLNG